QTPGLSQRHGSKLATLPPAGEQRRQPFGKSLGLVLDFNATIQFEAGTKPTTVSGDGGLAGASGLDHLDLQARAVEVGCDDDAALFDLAGEIGLKAEHLDSWHLAR